MSLDESLQPIQSIELVHTKNKLHVVMFGRDDDDSPVPVKTDKDGRIEMVSVVETTPTSPEPVYWFVTPEDSDPNTAKSIIKAGEAEKQHMVTYIEVVISSGTADDLVVVTLKSGSDVVWKSSLPSTAGERVVMNSCRGIPINVGDDAVLDVSAGGEDVVTTLNMSGYTL